jgi:hypothetical protein
MPDQWVQHSFRLNASGKPCDPKHAIHVCHAVLISVSSCTHLADLVSRVRMTCDYNERQNDNNRHLDHNASRPNQLCCWCNTIVHLSMMHRSKTNKSCSNTQIPTCALWTSDILWQTPIKHKISDVQRAQVGIWVLLQLLLVLLRCIMDKWTMVLHQQQSWFGREALWSRWRLLSFCLSL